MIDKNIPEEISKLFKQFDEGVITQGDFESQVHELFFNPVEWLEKGEVIWTFGSCCCASHVPDRTFKVDVTIQPHGYTIKRSE